MRNASILTTFSPETSYEELQSREEVARRGIGTFFAGGLAASATESLFKNFRKDKQEHQPEERRGLDSLELQPREEVARRGFETFVAGGIAASAAQNLYDDFKKQRRGLKTFVEGGLLAEGAEKVLDH